MSELGVLILVYVAGVLLLLGEIFIPSYGVLTVAGVGFLITGVIKTFSYGGREAGVAAMLACLVLLPTFAYLSIKYWPHTWVGRRIMPPNPVLTSADTSVPIDLLRELIGKTGTAVSALRPVGICEFGGHRVSCVADLGTVDAGATVRGTGIRSGNLSVSVVNA